MNYGDPVLVRSGMERHPAIWWFASRTRGKVWVVRRGSGEAFPMLVETRAVMVVDDAGFDMPRWARWE